MKIELKSIKYYASMSEETNCFQAAVWIDGQKAGDVSNEGRGGCHRYHPTSLRERLDAQAKTLPVRVTDMLDGDGKPFSYQPDADSVIDDLLADELRRRDLRRALGGKLLFTKADGKLYETKRMPAATLAAKLRDPGLPSRLSAVKVLNSLPFDEAYAVYRAAAA